MKKAVLMAGWLWIAVAGAQVAQAAQQDYAAGKTGVAELKAGSPRFIKLTNELY